MKRIKIHRRKISKTASDYYFTASEKKCVMVVYDSQWDFYGTPSGVHEILIEIHNNNAFIPNSMEEISIDEVPQAIIDLLTFLND